LNFGQRSAARGPQALPCYATECVTRYFLIRCKVQFVSCISCHSSVPFLFVQTSGDWLVCLRCSSFVGVFNFLLFIMILQSF